MVAQKTMVKRRRVLSKVVLALCVFVFVLEVVLQIAAFTTSMVMSSRAGGVSDEPHVLCIGDSFTYGQGATAAENAYPKALESILKKEGHDLSVINGGWPGRTSRDLIERFAAKLSRQTKVLCVLVGTNDSWVHPAEVTQTELDGIMSGEVATGGGFTWQFRTARLLMMMFGFETAAWLSTGQGDEAESAAAPPVDKVAKEGAAERYAQASKLLADAGFKSRRPRMLGGDPDGAVALKGFWPLMRKKDYDAARSVIVAALAKSPDSPTLLRAHVQVQSRSNQPFGEPLTRLQKLHESAPTPLTLECLMHAAMDASKPDLAMALAKERIAQEPDAGQAWSVLQKATYDLGLWDEFEPASTQAIELMADAFPAQSSWFLQNFARATAAKAPERAAQVAVAAFLLQPSEGEARLLARKMKGRGATRRMFEDVWKSVSIAGELVAQHRTVLDEVFDGKVDDAWEQVLVNHLKLLKDLASRNGTKVVVMSYPFLQKSLMRVHKRAAEELGLDLAPVTDRFAAELKTRDRGELFVSDGHCNDGGYALMAEVAAPLVLEALKK